MTGNSIEASAAVFKIGKLGMKARRLWDEAAEEAQAIAAEVFITDDRDELAARTNYLALFLGELEREGSDLLAPVVLRPIWNTTLEVPLGGAPAILRGLLSARPA